MSAAENSERYRVLHELCCAFAAQLDLDELVRTVIARCRQVLEAQGAAVLLLDEVRQELYFPYVDEDDPSVAEKLLEVRFPAGQGIAGAVLASGHSRAIPDAYDEPSFYGEVDKVTGLKTRTMLAAPLRTPRGTIGVVQLINRTGGGLFTGDDLALLDALSGPMAVAIENARMFAETKAREERLRARLGVLRRDMARNDRFGDIVGTSAVMGEVFRLMESAASSPISVVIEGETGTGKELVARGIHAASERADAPFVAVNCGALPSELLESELFGHTRGAFTGATADRRGVFEAADGGTIFLDEIGELPMQMQVKLLRVLQDGEVTPLGTTKKRQVDVRVISATNCDLKRAVASGAFRADLFYRIAAFPIRVPPLRDRPDDVPLLADRFLAVAAERHRKRIPGIEPQAFAMLAAYEWPGNVRQLRNEIERAVALTPEGETLGAFVLSADLGTTAHANNDVTRAGTTDGAEPEAATDAQAAFRATPDNGSASGASLRKARAAFEARFIAEQLRRHDGNVSHTAKALSISRVMLQKKMKEYGLR